MVRGYTDSQSIRRTLNIRIGIVVLVVGIVISALFVLISFKMEEDKFQHTIKLQTKHLSDAFTQQLWLLDHNAIQQLSGLAVDSPGICGLRIRDHNKKVLVESGVFSNTSATRISQALRYGRQTLVGYIDILYVNEDWMRHPKSIIITGISMMTIIIISSFLLISSILNHHLVRPLNRLQKDMIELTSGDFKRSEITGQKTEIQSIIDGFNQMAAALADREKSKQTAEIQLSKEKIFIEALIHTLPGLFYVYQEGRHLVRWNQNFEFVSGLDSRQMLNKHPEDWVSDKDKPAIARAVKEALTTGDASIEVELQLKNGPVPYFLTSTNFIADGINYILGIGMDLSQRKELEKALRQAQKMETIGTLAGGIAHDFNNILFPLLGYAEMLLEDLPESSPLRHGAEQIIQAALRARDLVQQILTVSRRSDQALKPLRVQSVLKEAIGLLKASIPKTIEIVADINPDCDLVVADPTQVHQIIMNLSTNAYHAMQKTGGQLKLVLDQVEIQGRPDDVHRPPPGNYVLLKVMDTGTGIDRSIADKIFDPYFTTKKTGKGTGLGLSIVQGIVKTWKGDVIVHSELGRGTQVYVYLPVMERCRPMVSQLPQTVFQRGCERILLVDDEPAVLEMEEELLTRMGYVVTAVDGSKKALEIFTSNPDQYDLILTDMTMPEMTGLGLAEEIKALRPDIPIVICTGFSDQINAENYKGDIHGFMTKPIVRSEISNTIREVLDRVPFSES